MKDHLTKAEFMLEKRNKSRELADGAIFIYPTDTIYGMGCLATHADAVERLRGLKGGEGNPFSIIAPSKEWILKNCEVDGAAKKWLGQLPGPYTLILNLKNRKAIHPGVNNSLRTVGIRIPDHWISGYVEELGIPLITTSANSLGGNFMTTIEELEEDIMSGVDFIVYDGKQAGKPSTIVDLTSKEPRITKRQ